MKAAEGSEVAVGCGTKQFPRLTAKLIEVGRERKLGHDVSIAARGPRPGAREDSRAMHNVVSTVEVDSVLPANPAAPPGAVAASLPRDEHSSGAGLNGNDTRHLNGLTPHHAHSKMPA
jgi:hypothetical protein